MSELEKSIGVFNQLLEDVLDSVKEIERALSGGAATPADGQSIRARLGSIKSTLKPLRGLVEEARMRSQAPPRPRFDESHPCEAIRGLKRPNLNQASKTMIDRLRHLQDRIVSRSLKGDVVDRELDEMAAILVVFEALEARP